LNGIRYGDAGNVFDDERADLVKNRERASDCVRILIRIEGAGALEGLELPTGGERRIRID
jgi:hypothetical protein